MTDIAERLRVALADRYLLERELGAGGMATVYLAQDLKNHRPVAVKVLHRDLAAALGPERFLREIAISARLTHPHILPLHDSGEADGFLYYTMPYVEGESLRDRLEREKQLPLEDALQVTREVADALAHAHGHGVVHRDIKPANILLEAGHAVVADFGVARAITEAGGEAITKSGLAVGTPAYMSPEQATGTRALDGRSDLYSLGCVLFEMLAGDPPFTASSAQALIAKKLNEPLPHISVVREAVPPHIEAALGRAMARVPADRFRSVAEFAAALSPEGRPMPTPATVAAPRRRLGRRPVAAAAALVILAVVALLVRPAVVKLFAGRTATTYGDTPRWSAWKGWTGEAFPLVAVSDSLLIVNRQGGRDVQVFDGRRWAALRIPEPFELNAYVGAIPDRRLFATKPARGPAGQDLQQYWWLSLSPDGLRPERPLSGFLPAPGRPVWWSDGRDLVTYLHSIQRLVGNAWVAEPTATTGLIASVWGRDADHRFALPSSPSDSLLVFDGISWKLVDPLGGRSSGRPSYVAGTTFQDGVTVVAGEECDAQERCRPLILQQDRFGARWRRMGIPVGIGIPTSPPRDTTGRCDPGRFTLLDVAGRARDDFLVSGEWVACEAGRPPRETAGCPPGRPCFWEAGRQGLRPVAELSGHLVQAAVYVDTTAYALADDGTLWRRVGATWRAVSRVPDLPVRLVGASRRLIVRVVGGDIRYEPGLGDTVSGFFASPFFGTTPGVGETRPPAQVVVRDSTAALLASDGTVFVSRCGMIRGASADRASALRCPPWERLPAAPGRIAAIDLLPDGRVVGVGPHGLAVSWTGRTVVREPLPAASRGDSLWGVVASADGRATAIGLGAVVQRDARGAWTLVRRWKGLGLEHARFGVLPNGDLVVAGRAIRVWDRSDDTLPVATLHTPTLGEAEVSALHVLSDGRLVAGFSSPTDRILGGRLVVWAPPARAARASQVDLPLNLDVTGMADDGEYLYVTGRGGALAIPLDALPFAPTLRPPEQRSTVVGAAR